MGRPGAVLKLKYCYSGQKDRNKNIFSVKKAVTKMGTMSFLPARQPPIFIPVAQLCPLPKFKPFKPRRIFQLWDKAVQPRKMLNL
jgi:hypothetical protein